MALRIRLQRHGNRHNPFYRVVVAENTSRRDGRYVELLGTYDPGNKNESLQRKLNLERTDYWLKVGAQPTDTVRSLIRKARKDQPEPVQTPEAEPSEA